MTCITDIANEIFDELSEPEDISIPAIAFWLRSNIGKLNNLLCQSYSIDTTSQNYEITPEINDNVKDIFKTLYAIYYFGRQANRNLGAANFNTTVEIESDGSRVRKVSKNDNSKMWLEVQKTAKNDLTQLLNHYKFCVAANSISSIAGEDGIYTKYQWVHYFRDYNRV
jgi:hypothetical protein